METEVRVTFVLTLEHEDGLSTDQLRQAVETVESDAQHELFGWQFMTEHGDGFHEFNVQNVETEACERCEDAAEPARTVKRLGSTDMIHTPGIVAWARRLDARTFNAEQTREFVQAGFLQATFPALDGYAVERLRKGEVDTDGDALLVKVGP